MPPRDKCEYLDYFSQSAKAFDVARERNSGTFFLPGEQKPKQQTQSLDFIRVCGGTSVGGWAHGEVGEGGLQVSVCLRCWVSAALCWNVSISELRGECGLLSGSSTSNALASSWESIRGCHAIRASCQQHADARVCAASCCSSAFGSQIFKP